jgi:hypothetical protein
MDGIKFWMILQWNNYAYTKDHKESTGAAYQ